MAEGWTRMRARAIESVATLQELLADSDVDDGRLVAGYLEAKRVLASAFEVFAVERYADPSVLVGVSTLVEQAMRSAYPELPTKYVRVRGFGEVHSRLLAYLAERVGIDVSAAELRMLTGDAVHTERRARELRDLGLRIDARHTSGSDVYVLRSTNPDTEIGARTLVAKNIREDRSISKAEGAELLQSVGLA